MNLTRYITTDIIDLDLPAPEEPPDNPDLNMEKFRQRQKEKFLEYFVGLLENSGMVLHRRKLLKDFINRERQASTALESGVAVPHVRSRYVRQTLVGFARSTEGIAFDSMDNQPSHLFFIIASPSHDGDLHLKMYRQIASMFRFDHVHEELMTTTRPGEVIRVLRQFD